MKEVEEDWFRWPGRYCWLECGRDRRRLAFAVDGSAVVCGSAAGRFAFALVVAVAVAVMGRGCSAGVIPGGAVRRGGGFVAGC